MKRQPSAKLDPNDAPLVLNLTCEVPLNESTFLFLVWQKLTMTIFSQIGPLGITGQGYTNRITNHELVFDDAAGTTTHSIMVDDVTQADRGLYTCMCVATISGYYKAGVGMLTVEFQGLYSSTI